MPAYVVVGAARGIGLSFIRQLAAQPANTIIAVNRKPGQETVERVHEVMGDLTDLSTLQRAAKEIEGIAKDGVDVLIASAVGHLQFISLLLPQLRKGTSKKIVYLTSNHGILSTVRMLGAQGRLPYSTSKSAADVAIVRISNQLRPEGFTVFSITPGTVLDREAYRAQGNDPEALEKALAKNWPGHSGIVSYDEGARLMLDVVERFGPDDSGRIVGMWGNEDKMG